MLRAAYREFLEAANADLMLMCDTSQSVMSHATAALLEQSLEDAEEALTEHDSLADIRQRCEDRSMRLLALQNPVASELREIVSSIYIMEHLNRMGSLSRNIALLSRQRHPASVYPPPLHGFVEEMARLTVEMGLTMRGLIEEPDPDAAIELHNLDEGIDDLKAYLTNLVTDREWEYTTREAVDLAILVRYFERYADRCVSVGARLVFQVTGMNPDAYVRQRDEPDFDPSEKFAEIERRFRRSGPQ